LIVDTTLVVTVVVAVFCNIVLYETTHPPQTENFTSLESLTLGAQHLTGCLMYHK